MLLQERAVEAFDDEARKVRAHTAVKRDGHPIMIKMATRNHGANYANDAVPHTEHGEYLELDGHLRHFRITLIATITTRWRSRLVRHHDLLDLVLHQYANTIVGVSVVLL
jgi:hypothetical protein